MRFDDIWRGRCITATTPEPSQYASNDAEEECSNSHQRNESLFLEFLLLMVTKGIAGIARYVFIRISCCTIGFDASFCLSVTTWCCNLFQRFVSTRGEFRDLPSPSTFGLV